VRLSNPLLCVAAALALASCGGDDSSDDTAGSTQAPAPSTSAETGAPGASATFVAPKEGSTAGDEFTAKVKIENFEINPDAVGKSPVPGQGHLHFQIDGGRYDVPANAGANGQLAAKLGVDGKYSPSLETHITYSKIPPGKHKLVCFLANNNHTPTGVQATTEFTVE
jgi:hypothetical protein